LVGAARSALFGTDSIMKASLLAMKLKDISVQEAEVIVNILGFIKPYVPPGSKYDIMSYHLPFVLMANRVLAAIGYQGQTVQLAPTVKPTKLHALRLDTPTLKAIQSNSSATSNKDCVYGSFFDIGRLYEVTAGYGLDFSQNLHVLPGLKVAKIYGTRNRLATSTAAPLAAQTTTQSASSSAKGTEDRIKGMRQDGYIKIIS
ncbi:hypothetical protein, partial, partial [Parasitella parasitica]